MRIQDLHGYAHGAPVLIIGTGPSTRVFPFLREFLDHGLLTIGLNQAWKHCDPVFNITVHPDLYLEWEASAGKRRTAKDGKWIIKPKPPMKHLTLDDPEHYVFNTSPDRETLVTRPQDTLYIGEGVQCTAMDLAARMGAGAIILIGCDACALSGEHHGHDQHVRFLGLKAEDQYYLYRKKTAHVRKVLREKFKIPTLTLSPFVGVGHAEEDYDRLCQELALPKLPRPKDVSPYTREKPKE
jgi:hypothetical protein